MPSVPPVPSIRVQNPSVRHLWRPLAISASGMEAQQRVMEVLANNMQNATTTRTVNGGPYRRQIAVLERDPTGMGVRVAQIVEDAAPGRSVYLPGHPDADVDGMVQFPNVDVIAELTNLMIARRVYEANATAFQTAKSMARRALEI